MNFGQVLTALVTPFKKDGNIDYEKTRELVEYLLSNGSDGFIVNGTTGESPTLSTSEKVEFIKFVKSVVGTRAPIIAGTGSNSTVESISLTKKVEELRVDGILLVAPYYNKPSQRGMYKHFVSIAHETKLPIMLYNIPGRSVVNMGSELIVELSKIDNIVSLKEAGTDLEQTSEIIERTGDGFTVYSGNDSLTLPLLSVGADGVVSVASHVIGNEMKQMIESFFNGDVHTAAKIHRKILPIMTGLFTAPSPAPVKAALKYKGLDVGDVRLPLVPLTNQERETLIQLFKNIGM